VLFRSHYIFLVTRWAGEPQNKRPDACAELRWAAAAELNGLSLIPLVRRGLQRALAAQAVAVAGAVGGKAR
jgi:hypothetical protein